ncbi:DUF6343 family protein [Streptomyces roseolus]|uniref:DUF6343 family protein n=1 Tax=Streptomyces roseolus TaxID=67358 RepID=UPI0016771D8C|nr:DUF6343 family protein [Streptomyces roseolus]GGR66779.1 hypothetical protein GCM10010282_69690 [Streptomyces roseolus]
MGRSEWRSGREPVTARSDLKLRLLLLLVFTPLFAAATIAFAFWAARADDDALGPGVPAALAVFCGLLTVTAAIDLVVVARRRSSKT